MWCVQYGVRITVRARDACCSVAVWWGAMLVVCRHFVPAMRGDEQQHLLVMSMMMRHMYRQQYAGGMRIICRVCRVFMWYYAVHDLFSLVILC